MATKTTRKEAELKIYLGKGRAAVIWSLIISFLSAAWLMLVLVERSTSAGKDSLLMVIFAIAFIAAMGLTALSSIIEILRDIKIELHKLNKTTF